MIGASMLALVCMNAAFAGGGNSNSNINHAGGVPDLQRQIDELRAQINGLGTGGDTVVAVLCPQDSINAAIEAAPPNGRLIIKVVGTCDEQVEISRDNVTLDGNGTGSIQPSNPASDGVRINGARSVSLVGLSISAGDDGVVAFADAQFSLVDSTVDGTGDVGVLLYQASASISASTISNSQGDGIGLFNHATATIGGFGAPTDAVTISGSGAIGLNIFAGSTVYLTGTEIAGNDQGISVSANSTLNMRGGNLISGSIGLGVWAGQSSTVYQPSSAGLDRIENNGADGLHISENSASRLRNISITGNQGYGFVIRRGSYARMRESAVATGNSGWTNSDPDFRVRTDSLLTLSSDLILTAGSAIRCESGGSVEDNMASAASTVGCTVY